MKVKVYPSHLTGTINAVASKSYAHRYLIGAMLADGPTEIVMNSLSNDVSATIKCIECLGGKVRVHKDRYKVTPIGRDLAKNRILDCKESASTLRFLFPIICALGCGGTFIGEGRLEDRPITPLITAGDGCIFSGDKLPITVNGKMKSGKILLPADVSSQYVTGLLYALPLLDNDSEIIFTTTPVSTPYIDMTVAVLKHFNVTSQKTPTGYKIKGGQRYITPVNLEVEGDWSNMAFFYCANAIGNIIRILGLSANTLQGDACINEQLLKIRSSKGEIDCKDTPDLLPCLAVTSAYSTGTTTFKNVGMFRSKESNRITALESNLAKLGIEVTKNADELVIKGNGMLNGGEIDSFNDHRIVMSFAIAATKANGPITINNAECVAKSYPTFFDEMQKLGAKIEIIN